MVSVPFCSARILPIFSMASTMSRRGTAEPISNMPKSNWSVTEMVTPSLPATTVRPSASLLVRAERGGELLADVVGGLGRGGARLAFRAVRTFSARGSAAVPQPWLLSAARAVRRPQGPARLAGRAFPASPVAPRARRLAALRRIAFRPPSAASRNPARTDRDRPRRRSAGRGTGGLHAAVALGADILQQRRFPRRSRTARRRDWRRDARRNASRCGFRR